MRAVCGARPLRRRRTTRAAQARPPRRRHAAAGLRVRRHRRVRLRGVSPAARRVAQRAPGARGWPRGRHCHVRPEPPADPLRQPCPQTSHRCSAAHEAPAERPRREQHLSQGPRRTRARARGDSEAHHAMTPAAHTPAHRPSGPLPMMWRVQAAQGAPGALPASRSRLQAGARHPDALTRRVRPGARHRDALMRRVRRSGARHRDALTRRVRSGARGRWRQGS
jgi:hypothetical protein